MSRACWNCGGSGVRCCEFGADVEVATGPTYAVGDRVVYFQPGIDAILASWSGRRAPRNPSDPGEEKLATIKAISVDSTSTYYDTVEGVLLTDADIRRKAVTR